MSISSLDSINKTLSKILDFNFLDKLKEVRKVNFNGRDEHIFDQPNVVLQAVEETFRLRHVFAHEMKANEIIDGEYLGNASCRVDLFIDAIGIMIDSIIYSTEIENRERKIEDTGAVLAEIERQYVSRKTAIFEYFTHNLEMENADIEVYEAMNSSWEAFAEADARFNAKMDVISRNSLEERYNIAKASHFSQRLKETAWLQGLQEII